MSNAAQIVDSYPLSPMQQGMLYHALSEPHSGVDIEQLTITLRQPVDAIRLRLAWERVVARHPVLRTGFTVTDSGPKQVIYSEVELPFEVEDWSAEPDEQKDAHFESWLQQDRARGFQMDRAPLLRFRLWRWGPADFRLVWTFHHALLDGRSFPPMLEEAFHFYADAQYHAPPVPRAYRDFIEWLQVRDHAAEENYWRAQLVGFTTPTALPVLGLPGCATTRQQGDAEISLSSETTRSLRELAESDGVTLNTLVQAAWAILLSRYSGEEDVCFGATRAGRRGAIDGADAMVGLFINTIPVRARVPRSLSIRELLHELRKSWVEARPFEHAPLARVQSWSQLPAGQPLFQTLVVFENYDLRTHFASIPDWASRELRLREQTSFPLCLAAYAGSQLRLVAEYDRSRLDEDSVARLLGHLQTILTSLARGAATVGDVEMLPQAERESLLALWEHAGSAKVTKTLHELFEEQVARTPDAIAIVQEPVRLTYAQLNVRAEVVASHLIAAGAGPETIVGLCLERTPELVVGLLGILKANAAYLPIDLAYPAERLAFMLEDAQAPILLTQRHLIAELPHLGSAKVLAIDELRERAPAAPRSSGTPDQLCYVIYTSGSTGKPKGCCITHRNVTRLFTATAPWFGFHAGDVWTLFHSTAFDFSVWEIWGALLHGGRLVVIPFSISRSPEQFRQLLATESVTVLNQTPSAFRQLIAADAEQNSSLALRHVIFGGEALEMQSLKPWFDRYGDSTPQLVNMYGITETTVHVTYRPLRAEDVQGSSVIGCPIPDLRMLILDPQLQPVPVGVPGELHVGGAGLARGYLRRPELTAERFIDDPFHAGERLYKTGDSARLLPGGDVEYLGRIDQQVKIRGFRIELGEIEAVLLKHPAIRETAVLPRPDGAGGKRLVAWLVCEGIAPDASELRIHLKRYLPDYMVPAAYVPIERMPLTNNGKLDSRALPEPSHDRPQVGATYTAPRNDAERTLAMIWSRVLKVESVGVHDNFFELGGDSILSISVVAQARKAGIELTPKQLFDLPTISELVATVAPSAPRLRERSASGDVPLTPIQQWFFAQDFADSHHWNQSFTFALTRTISRAAMASALEKVLAAHPVFQLRFVREGGRWRQTFGPATPATELLAPTGHDLQSALRLEGPLARFSFDGQRLTIAMHHLIVDGVSWRVFLEDLQAALNGLAISAATTGFHTWAHAMRAAVMSPKLNEELPYWTSLLAEPCNSLPADRPNSANYEATAETIAVELTTEETTALQHALSAQSARIHDALLHALGQSLTNWANVPAITVDVEGHGREEDFLSALCGVPNTADLSHTIGWFTTIYPARLQREATLAQTRAALAATPRRGFGYSLLNARGAVAPSQSEVLFNYLGHFDLLTEGLSDFRLNGFSTAGWHAPRARRTHVLEVNALILDGRLQARWTFSRAIHDQANIAALTESFRAALQSIASAGMFAFSPLPAPLVRANYPTAEDAYPLAPMQRLFYTLEAAKAGSGNDQWHCRLRGPLVAERFQRAWGNVIARHPSLRTAYLAEPEPMSVVLQNATPAWRIEDLSHLPAEEQSRRIDAFLQEDAIQPFDLTRAPLTRFALFRLGTDDHRFVWTHHHLEIDGWSWPIVFREVAAHYEEKSLAPAKPYREFISWLTRPRSSEDFWRAQLRGFRVQTPLPVQASSDSPELQTSITIGAPLQELAQRARVTLNAICQAAWAILLAQRSGMNDVVFGAAVSGRPADLDGAGSIVGHFVNNLPARARVDLGQPFTNLCAQMHAQLAALTEHQHAALAEIQGWSELPWNARLFTTLLVFQNYATSDRPWQFGSVKVEGLHAPVRANYPLTIVIQPGDESIVSFIAQPRTTSREELSDLAANFADLLATASTNPQIAVGDMTRHWSPKPPSSTSTATPLPVRSFGTPNEQMIAEIWQAALGRPVTETDNFFDLGGHSLLMLQVHRRLCAKLQRELPVVSLFQYPTIRSLAGFLSGAPATACTTPVASAVHDRAAKARAAIARQQRPRTK